MKYLNVNFGFYYVTLLIIWQPKCIGSIIEQDSDKSNLDRTKRVSLVAWVNVKLNGTYPFSFEQNVVDLDKITRVIVEN
ncbi:hypothetical protein AB835_06600 [Candidatus Endobugula sertula]|uniref:Uncharacterized protein n=1 Tax=Candidatus Endobugula sertula TaxID=62101 RepID=A0A1D2QQM8_9GAMM|nr:hypothetical protein AB835_06600 [Candidatus Endobugula sertula]